MRQNLRHKRLKMSNSRLENILLIKINGPVLHKTYKDFDNILVWWAIDLYFHKDNWRCNLCTTSKENLRKNKESSFGPPIKRAVQEISSSNDSSSESDSSEPGSDKNIMPHYLFWANAPFLHPLP